MDNETVNIDGVLKSAQQKLGRDYHFLQHLGGGEYSNVYLIQHRKSAQKHALKVLDYHYLLQKLKKEDLQNAINKFNEIKSRFITEAKLYKRIHHPNIVKIHDTGIIPDSIKKIEIPYMIMTYIKGSSLSDLIRYKTKFKYEQILKISNGVLSALKSMHENNIIHRDIKPGNIMIEKESGEAIIIDFGIAKEIVGGARLTTTGALLGSPMYMAPEQSINSSNVGPHTDIYSFGAVLFELFTGHPPFDGSNFLEIMTSHRKRIIPNIEEINPDLPKGISQIITKAMAKRPSERFANTSDFLNNLKKVLNQPEFPYKKKIRKPIFKKYPVYICIFLFTAVAIFILLKPFAIGKKEKMPTINTSSIHAKSVKTHPKIKIINKTSQFNQQKRMDLKSDYLALKESLSKNAQIKQKINQCQNFLKKINSIKDIDSKFTADMASEVKRTLKHLENEVRDENQYLRKIAEIKNLIANHQFQKASRILSQINETKQNPEIKKLAIQIENQKNQFEKLNGTKGFAAIKDQINLEQFISFQQTYPGSIYLQELKDQLIKSDSHLPPESYWKAIKKNQKGYYELVLNKDQNYHQMIYIPEKKIWMDKYEVSNQNFRKFLEKEKQSLPLHSTSKFIHQGNNYPAVVSYNEAEKYCQCYGLRLPHLDEWVYVAGKEMYLFPWGNSPPRENQIWKANFDSLGEDGKEKDKFEGTSPVHSFENYSSPFGAVNMAGNVWEWVQGRILKGGSFLSAPEELMIKNSIAGRADDTQGFRCIKDEK